MMKNIHEEKNVVRFHIHNTVLNIYMKSYTIIKEEKEINIHEGTYDINNMMFKVLA
jgi:hypothetical protein